MQCSAAITITPLSLGGVTRALRVRKPTVFIPPARAVTALTPQAEKILKDEKNRQETSHHLPLGSSSIPLCTYSRDPVCRVTRFFFHALSRHFFSIQHFETLLWETCDARTFGWCSSHRQIQWSQRIAYLGFMSYTEGTHNSGKNLKIATDHSKQKLLLN